MYVHVQYRIRDHGMNFIFPPSTFPEQLEHGHIPSSVQEDERVCR